MFLEDSWSTSVSLFPEYFMNISVPNGWMLFFISPFRLQHKYIFLHVAGIWNKRIFVAWGNKQKDMHSVQFNTIATTECFLQFTLTLLHSPGTWHNVPFILYFNINFLPITLCASLPLKSRQIVRNRYSL